ncbi:PA14 domain-containing protein [Hymenobacter actinosclerus]|uniref:Outer membrane protein OmpA n=1 Tax=Hymenobacter actinosclerus TaxID=82805 RepID=A0A1I0J2W1_9BACT|nr:PA14 domain-containing protein [Hymenobacter actinosclerus]SEU04023.1 Outer membrane protein OmpA [Hymenobacter actinosclerus]
MPQLSTLAWAAGLLLTNSLASHAQTLTPRGLTGTYYRGQNFEQPVLTRIDNQLDFEWKKRAPAPGVPAEHFSARWTGFLEAPVTGQYILHLTVDDGVRVWLGGRLLFESWKDQYFTNGQAKVRLEAGQRYALRVEYYQNALDSRLLLAWQRPDASLADFFGGQSIVQPVPMRYLWSARPVRMKLANAADSAAFLAARMAGVKTTPVKAALVIGYRPRPKLAPRPAAVVPTKPAARPPLPKPVPIKARPALTELGSLAKGAVLALPNLYFSQSTADLLPASRPVLDELAQTLRRQPALRLEIAGHTDNVGDAARNRLLSQQRARVVRRYLVQQGIDSLRLTAVGYGGAYPVADNRNPALRPRNRRVEVVVR